MAFRFLIVDTSGDVTGTDDNPPDISDSDSIVCIIDTEQGQYNNDDLDDEPIMQYEGADDSDNDSDED